MGIHNGKYSKIGHYFTWKTKDGKNCKNKYSDEFLKYCENINDYFTGWEDDKIKLTFPEENKEEIMLETLFNLMKQELEPDEAKRLIKQREYEQTYHTKSIKKAMEKKFMDLFTNKKPFTKDIFNLQQIIEVLIENDGNWTPISDKLAKCKFDLSEKQTPNKMAHNKITALEKAEFVEKSENGKEARIMPSVMKELRK